MIIHTTRMRPYVLPVEARFHSLTNMRITIMRHIGIFVLLLIGMSATGCFHAQVTTGLTPGPTVIEQSFASGWIYGLVPPSTVEAASQCPNGVARVETKLSFVNQVVMAVTLGIYSPMHITVTCAAATSASSFELPESHLTITSDAVDAEIQDAFSRAADQAVASGESVLVRFE